LSTWAPNEALPKVKLPDGFPAKLMSENARQLYKLPARTGAGLHPDPARDPHAAGVPIVGCTATFGGT